MKFNVYYDSSVEFILFKSVDTLDEAQQFIAGELVGRTLVDDEHQCSDDVFNSSKVAVYEVYEGEPWILDEDGDVADLKDPIFRSSYFYTD